MTAGNKYQFSSFFTKGQYETQVETVEILEAGKGIEIGLPKEGSFNESRVLLVPNSIRSIIGYGHRVVVESGSGVRSHFSDEDFASAGATITQDKNKVYGAQVVIKSSPPTLEELDLIQPGTILLTPLHLLLISKEYILKLKARKILAMAMEYLKYDDGSFPVIRISSEIAGRLAILTAAELLSNNAGGRGVLLGGVSGVPPAKVVVLGAGVIGEHAVRTALGLGASVRVFDNDIYKIIRLQNVVGQQLHTSSINPEYMAYQLTSADVVVGAVHSNTGRAPILVTEQMIQNMKNGSVVIDMSIDQGGCFETSKMTTHDKPTFVKHGVIHYCVPNMASKVGRTSSQAISNILTPLMLRLGGRQRIADLLYQYEGIRHGVYTYGGHSTNEYLSKRFEIKYTALELLLPSNQ